ncbi:MAG: hypothetical protein R3F61_26330 [Myxococcota bacterium]
MILALFIACASPEPTVVGTRPAAEREVPAHCPRPGAPEVRGALASGELDEVSGLVKSRQHEVFWVHNDSGDEPRVFAVGPSGADRGTVSLRGAEATDWEDMTRLPAESGRDWLVLGDIGDNREKRASVQLYRIAEPVPGAVASVDAARMEVRYPDGAHNAEVLLADPRDGGLYILTKSDHGLSGLYSVGPWKTGEVVAERVAEVQFPTGYGDAKATGGDISEDGRWLVIRTYTTAWMFAIEGSLKDALAGERCEVRPPVEEQGEAITFVEGGFVTVSEGKGAPLHYVPLTYPAPTPE